MELHLLVLTSVFFLYLFHHLYWKRRGLPPGPIPLPIVGNMLDIVWHAPGYGAIKKWTDKYGGCFTMWMGPKPVVFITTWNYIQKSVGGPEADAYADRYAPDYMLDVIKDKKQSAIFFASGAIWRESRKMGAKALRNFGLGSKLMEKRILQEVDTLLADWENSKFVSPHDQFDVRIGSLMNNLLFGYRFNEKNEHEFRELRKMVTRQLALILYPAMHAMGALPILRNLPYFRDIYHESLQHKAAVSGFMERHVREHITRREQEISKCPDGNVEEPSDIVDYLLREAEVASAETKEYYSMENIREICMDFWGAGMDSTANTLTWGIAFLLNEPDTQKALYAEMREKVDWLTKDENRLITEEERETLVQMSAFVSEVQRCGSISDIMVARQTTRPVKIGEFELPAGTAVTPNHPNLLYDEKVFPNPRKFDHRRFIDPDTGKLLKIPQCLPFGIGARRCPGERLAIAELFLFFANIVARFELLPEKDDCPPSLARKHLSPVVIVPRFVFRAKRRQHA